MGVVLTIAYFAGLFAVAGLLVALFLRSRNIGYVVLTIPLVIWPAVSRWIWPWLTERAIYGRVPWPLSMLLGDADPGAESFARLANLAGVVSVAGLVVGFALVWVGDRHVRGDRQPPNPATQQTAAAAPGDAHER